MVQCVLFKKLVLYEQIPMMKTNLKPRSAQQVMVSAGQAVWGKYSRYLDEMENKELRNMVKEFKKGSREHTKSIKDLMIKLNLQG